MRCDGEAAAEVWLPWGPVVTKTSSCRIPRCHIPLSRNGDRHFLARRVWVDNLVVGGEDLVPAR